MLIRARLVVPILYVLLAGMAFPALASQTITPREARNHIGETGCTTSFLPHTYAGLPR